MSSASPSSPNPPGAPELRDTPVVRWTAALLTAAFVSFSLPTIDWAPFAFIAWIPLLVWLPAATSTRRRFLFGWVVGIGYQLVIFRWIPFTVTEMTSLPDWVALAMCGAYALWHGLQIAVFALFANPLRTFMHRRAPAFAPFAIAALFAVLEWLWPVVFPWSIAHAAWQLPPVHNIAAFFGIPGVVTFILLPQVALGNYLHERFFSNERPSVRAFRWPILQAAFLLALGTFWWQHASHAPVVGTLRVAVVQPNYTLEEKKHANFEMRRKLLDRFETQLRAIQPFRFDLIVASEGAFPLYWRVDTPPLSEEVAGPQAATRRIQRAIAEGPATRAMIGGLRQVPGAEGDNEIANSVVFFEADGTIAGSYDKRLLVPFSEYMPFSDLIPSLKNAVRGIGHLRRGTNDCAFAVGDIPATCGICYETLFSNETRAGVGNARILTNFTIDTWFGKATAPRLHLASHSTRAIELGIPLVRSALTGVSAVIDPTGRVLGSLELDVTGVLEVDVPMVDLSPPYRFLGPAFAWVCCGLLLGLWVFITIDKRRAKNRSPREPNAAHGVTGSDGVQKASVPAPTGGTDEVAGNTKTSGSPDA